MSTEKKFFLCSICAKQIQSNRFNLDQHEKLHNSLISKIKCAAKNCDSTFSNKSIYWRHWNVKHSGITMPDFLIYIDIPSQRRRQNKPNKLTGLGKNGKKVYKDEATQMVMTTHAAQTDESKNYGVCAAEIVEKPNDFLCFNIEKTIEDCLIRNPYYGCLNYSSV